jgi:DNA repair protein RadC
MKTVKLLELKKIQTDFPAVKITNSNTSAKFIRQFYSDDLGIFESFFILLLNRQNQTTGYAKISQGGVAGTVVDVKIIAKYAVDFLASSVILAHNHPSGNLNPSSQDIDATQKVKEALSLLDVQVLDHIILTEESYYSFADNALI